MSEKKIDKDVGFIEDDTDIQVNTDSNSLVTLSGNAKQAKTLFKTDFRFEDIGIGGLDDQLTNIFRSAFASRRFPENELKKYGI